MEVDVARLNVLSEWQRLKVNFRSYNLTLLGSHDILFKLTKKRLLAYSIGV